MLISSQHAYTLNPVTALAYYNVFDNTKQTELLLVGEGAFLKVYEAETSSFVAQCRIFASQTIHGIAVREQRTSDTDSLTIWGGRSFVLLHEKELRKIVSGDIDSVVSKETIASDWILDGAFSPSDHCGSCVFITAHNVALHVSSVVEPARPQIRSLSSSSRSILYSAHIVWTSNSSIMVAAGTVFGDIEIVIWDLEDSDTVKSGDIIFTFTGHEGSIFGVQISPEIRDPSGQPTRILASCSDDRTIRLWDLSSLGSHQPVSSQSSVPLLRETGFGEDISDSQNGLSAKRCIATVMGHASRIWKVRFITPKTIEADQSTPVNVLSFGEDSTVQQWALTGWIKESTASNIISQDEPISAATATSAKAALIHIKTYGYHTGKHIWSSALLNFGESWNTLATGGADGEVSTFDIYVDGPPSGQASIEEDQSNGACDAPEEYKQTISRVRTLDTILDELPARPLFKESVSTTKLLEPEELALEYSAKPQKKKKKKPTAIAKDALSKYALVRSNQLLFTTTFGRVITQSTLYPHKWLELLLPEGSELDLKSYSIVTSVPEHEAAILAGANGKVYMYYSPRAIEEIADLKHKVAGLFCLPGQLNDTIRILATTLGGEQAVLITLIPLSSEETVTDHMDLPPSFVVTSAGVVGELIILGSRNGQLAVYDLTIANTPQSIIVDKRFRCHDAITSIVEVPATNGAPPYFVVTARDGTYAIFAAYLQKPSEGTSIVTFELVHHVALPFGPMIEGAFFCGTSLIIHGFRSKNFIVWNESKQCELSSVECGGAHRSYAFSTLPKYSGGSFFAYTKASKLCMQEQFRPCYKTVKEGGHGREIKACAVSEDQQLIATAAEDTNIRIWRYAEYHDPLLNKLECYTILRKHSAGIQHLQWANISDTSKYLFSGGGYEEFNVWAISWIPGFGLGAVCEATLSDLSEEHDLRIMSFDVVATGGEEQEGDAVSEKTYMIAIAFSDSTIRAYWYSKSQGFEKLAHGRYTSACLTQINVLPSSTGETMVLTASTDGHLALWEICDDDEEEVDEAQGLELSLVQRTKIHQSGILSLDVLPIGPEGFIIATGGDDNAVALTYMAGRKFGIRMIAPSAHAAGVNGLCYVAHNHDSGDNEGKFRFCTVGGDQKVKNWTVEVIAEFGPEGFDLKEMRWQEMADGDEVATTVPDAAGIATFGGHCHHKHCLVYGNGIDIFEV